MPGGHKNIRPEDRTRGFDTHPENINRKGRPPSAEKRLVSVINKEYEKLGYKPISPSDIGKAILLILQLPFSEIELLAKKENDDYPFYYKIIAKELIGKRGGDALEKLLDRVLGKNVNLNLRTGVTLEVYEDETDL